MSVCIMYIGAQHYNFITVCLYRNSHHSKIEPPQDAIDLTRHLTVIGLTIRLTVIDLTIHLTVIDLTIHLTYDTSQ